MWDGVERAKLWQAVALSLDIEPRPARNKAQLFLRLEQDVCSHLEVRLREAEQHVGYEELLVPEGFSGDDENTTILISEYITLAEHLGWSFPAKMKEITRTNTVLDKAPDAKYQLPIENPAPDKEAINSTSPKKDLTTKERETLLKIILAAAIHGLDYDPQEKKSAVPKRLADKIESLGMRLDVDTVRNKLKAASEFLPSDWKKR